MNIKLLKDEPKIILSEKAYEKMKYYVKMNQLILLQMFI